MKVSGFSDTIAWYDENAKQYSEVNAGIADIDQIEELAGLLPSGAAILDAGCAAGRDCKLFWDRGFKVTGVDVSEGLIDVAHSNFLELPFEDKSFEAVWAHQSLLHLETPKDVQKALSEFHRILKPGGVLLTLVKSQTDENKTAVVADDLSGHDRFFQYFTQQELQTLLSQAGFSVTKLEEYRESDKRPDGRPEVGLIYSISRKQVNDIL
jgi:ubiquinone/menaquinone biosynthesis C-methylase UbiE